jgi:D-alanyl-D-alanine carboxypeptidase (penicillin-binding protein 5/6)
VLASSHSRCRVDLEESESGDCVENVPRAPRVEKLRSNRNLPSALLREPHHGMKVQMRWLSRGRTGLCAAVIVWAMWLRVGAGLLLLLVGFLTFNYFRPIPSVAAGASVPTSTTIAGTPPVLPWPSVGSAAVAVSGLGLVANSGNESKVPIASVAKVMTALIVLEEKPLKKSEQGPSILITDADVQAYQTDKADQQSVVAVSAGEQLPEFQALQGLLIPSGNNIAFTLANWDAGSVTAFVAKMNKRAKELRMSHTVFADPAGALAQTVSTPSDLVILGIKAMKQEVFAQIVATTDAKLPVAGTVYNVDYVLGQSGIIGIKTGSGLNSGANFLFAASATVGGFTVVMFGCVMGQPTLDRAFAAAKALIAAMQPAITVKRILSKYQAVGSYEMPWGGRSDLLSTSNVDLVEWPGMILRQSLHAPTLTITQPLPAGTTEGALNMVLGDYNLDVPLTTADALYPPGRFWKLTRI